MNWVRFIGIPVLVFGVLTQCFSQSINIIVVGDPRTFCESVAKPGQSPVDALRRVVPRDGEIWLVVSRRVDAWWSVARGRSERDKMLRDAAGEIERARHYPVFFDPAPTVAEIQARLLARSGGQTSPTVVWLASTRIGQGIPARLETAPTVFSDSVVTKEEIKRASEVIAPFAGSVWGTYFLLLLGVGSVLVTGIIVLRKRRTKAEEFEQWLNDQMSKVQDDGGIGGSSSIGRPSSEDWRIEEPDNAEGSNRQIFLNLLVLLLTLLVAGVGIEARAQDYRVLDVSLSEAVGLRETAKQEIALRILNKRSVDLWFFGDSLRYAGRISSLRQLDSVFNALPGDGKTRLAEALTHMKAIVDDARRKGQKPLLVWFTDYVEDDANNKALATGLVFPATRPDTSRVSAPSLTGEGLTFEAGLVLGGLGIAFVCVLLNALRAAREKKLAPYHTRHVAVSVGDTTVTKSMEEMAARGLTIGSTFDADVRSFNIDSYGLKASRENGHLQLRVARLDTKQEPILISLS